MFLFAAFYCFYQHTGKGALRTFSWQTFRPYQALQACTEVYTQRIQRIQYLFKRLLYRYIPITKCAITIQLPLR